MFLGPRRQVARRQEPAADCSWIEERLSSREETARAIERVLVAMQDRGFSPRDVLAVHISLEEAIVNAIRHGNQDDPAKTVLVRVQVNPECVLAEVEDQGQGFDPVGVPDPFAAENMDRPSGRGVLLMRSLMQWVRYNARGNNVSFCRLRGQTDQQSLPLAG